MSGKDKKTKQTEEEDANYMIEREEVVNHLKCKFSKGEPEAVNA